MTSTSRCPRCYTPLRPTESPGGLCPKCLISVAMGEPAVHRSMTGAPLPPPPSPEELAEHFPQLDIGEVIGRGGMGVVYGAVQRDLDRMVALKVLTVDHEADPTFSERFQREARAMASLSHPNIAAVYDSGRAGPWYYLMLELVDGPNLRQVIADGDISSSNALRIVGEMCVALDFAHSEGVVHRDIKPENVLLDPKGRVKIVDFGLAKLVTPGIGNPTLTRTDQAMGTMHYVAPEQVRRPLEVDHRADIYSMGVVFYELLTGELPMGRFEVPSKLRSTDPRVDPVVLKALENDPERRYQHASDVQLDVDHIRQTPPGRPARVRGKGRRKEVSKGERKSGTFAGLPTVLVGCLALSSISFMFMILGYVLLSKADDPTPDRFTGTSNHTLNDPPPITSSTTSHGPGAQTSDSIPIDEAYRMIGTGEDGSDVVSGPKFESLDGADRLARAVGMYPLTNENLREDLATIWLSYRAVEIAAAQVTTVPWDKNWLRVEVAAFPHQLEGIREQVLRSIEIQDDAERADLELRLQHPELFPCGTDTRMFLVNDTGQDWEVENGAGQLIHQWQAGQALPPSLKILEHLLTREVRRGIRFHHSRWSAPFRDLGLGLRTTPTKVWEAGQQAWDEYRQFESMHSQAVLTVGEEDGQTLKTVDLRIDPFESDVNRIVAKLEKAIRENLPEQEAAETLRRLNVDALCPFGINHMHVRITRVGGVYRCVDVGRQKRAELTGIADPEAFGEVPELKSTIAHWNRYFTDLRVESEPTNGTAVEPQFATTDGVEYLARLAGQWPLEEDSLRAPLEQAWSNYVDGILRESQLQPDYGNQEWLRVEVGGSGEASFTLLAECTEAFQQVDRNAGKTVRDRLSDPRALLWGSSPETFWVRKKGLAWEAWDKRFGLVTYTPGLPVDTRIAMLESLLTPERVEAARQKPVRWDAPFHEFGMPTHQVSSEILDLVQELWDGYREAEWALADATVSARTAEKREKFPDIREVTLVIPAFQDVRNELLQTFIQELDRVADRETSRPILTSLQTDILCPFGEKAESFSLSFSPGCLQVWSYDVGDGKRVATGGEIFRPIPVRLRHWLRYAELPEPE